MVNFKVGSHLTIIFAFFLYYAFSKNKNKISVKWLFSGLYINVLAAMAQTLVPDLWGNLVGGYLISDFRASIHDGRGAGGVNPEAGFLGAIIVGYLAMASYFLDTKRISLKYFLFNVFVGVSGILLSGSGTGFVLLVFWAGIVFLLSNIPILLKICFIILSMLVAPLTIKLLGLDARGVDVIVRLMQEPQLFMLTDVSFLLRLLAFLAGPLSMLDGYIFGVGVGSFDHVAPTVISEHVAGFGSEEALYRIVEANGGSSALGRLICEMGLWAVILVSFLVLASKLSRPCLPLVCFGFIFMSFSFSFSFPLTWMMLAFCNKSNSGKEDAI